MRRFLSFAIALSITVPGTIRGQDWVSPFTGVSAQTPVIKALSVDRPRWPDSLTEASGANVRPLHNVSLLDLEGQSDSFDFSDYLVRYQGGDGASGGGGAGASAATDPSAILTQFQIQNVFTPETYDASGYSNTLILQPVLPFPIAMPGLKEIFPNHIIRPTLPIIAPTADPDGPLGVQSGLGDLTVLDVGVHPVEGFGTVILGYTAILPTATDAQLGLDEWQLGPAAGVLYKQIPKTLLGVIYQQPFSFESDA